MYTNKVDAAPSVILRLSKFFGKYERAIAWLAVHGDKNFDESSESAVLIADLYGAEIGQVVSDVRVMRKREERERPYRSIADQRLFYATK